MTSAMGVHCGVGIRRGILLACCFSIGQALIAQPLAAGLSKFLGNVYGTTVGVNFDLYWNQVTPENAGKWGNCEITRDQEKWTALDQSYDYARSRGFPFKIHTLIWGQSQPSWITQLDSASQAAEIEEWIQHVAARYPQTDFVDVVNEPLHAPAPYRNALGGDGATGWDWVIRAFQLARKYFSPNTKLILNEYNVISGDASTSSFLRIVSALQSRNLIDGIGDQCHYFEIGDVETATLKRNLDRLAATGLPVYISELDIVEADDNTQLQKMQTFFPVLWGNAGVKGITFWGYVQGQIWQGNGYLVRSDGSERPALQWLRTYLSSTASVAEGGLHPSEMRLAQNYPNPFNPTTRISYSLPSGGHVRLDVVDILGKTVATLVNGDAQAGTHEVNFDGARLASGTYLYRLSTSHGILTKRMVLTR